MKSGPGTNEEPIMIDSDGDEVVAPLLQSVASVPQSQLEHAYSTDREGSTEEEEFGLYEEQEEEGYISDDSIDGVYADRQGQELIDVKVIGGQGDNGAQRLDVEHIQEVSGKSNSSGEIVADIQTNNIESAREHNTGRAGRFTPLAEDVQTYQVIQGSGPPLFPDSTQNKTSLAGPIAEESCVASSMAQIIEQPTYGE